MMRAFRVWVTPLDYEYSVCADGPGNARWLLAELAGSFVFSNAQPICYKEEKPMERIQIGDRVVDTVLENTEQQGANWD